MAFNGPSSGECSMVGLGKKVPNSVKSCPNEQKVAQETGGDGGDTMSRKNSFFIFKCHVFQSVRALLNRFFVRSALVGTGFAYVSAKPMRNRRPQPMASFVVHNLYALANCCAGHSCGVSKRP